MIPIFDLKRQNITLKKELDRAIGQVMAGGVFILGPLVSTFEKRCADYIGVKYALGVASGTDALTLALLSLDIGAGDEVILPANAYPSVFALTAIGITPKLVDIDPGTYNIDPKQIPQAITKKTKAIIPVHLYGQPADMPAILAIGKKYKIPVIEDCAQAHGAEISIQLQSVLSTQQNTNILKTENRKLTTFWKKVGSMGDVGCFSFYPTKNLGCFGDGGMIVTNNKEIYEKAKLLRMYGEKSRYNSVILGRNSRLDELQAAILLVKLKYLDKWNERRREIAYQYISLLTGPVTRVSQDSVQVPAYAQASAGKLRDTYSSNPSGDSRLDGVPRLGPSADGSLVPPAVIEENMGHVYHLFVIRSKKRDQLKKYLEDNGVGSAIHYPVPIHLVPSFSNLGYKIGDFPESERASREVLSLPIYPELTNTEVETICQLIRKS